MSAMVINRSVVLQALKAMEANRYAVADQAPHGDVMAYNVATEALRAAVLAQEQAEPVQEPVAKVELMMTGGNAGLATRIVEIDDPLRERLRPGQVLYTAPPQRKPLTEEEIFAIENDIPDDVVSDRHWTIWYARAIERAHGIIESEIKEDKA